VQNNLSQFWQYRIFTSKRKRNEFRFEGKSEKKYNKTLWCGPFAFCGKINEIEFRKWIREHLGVKTEHIECQVSESEFKNKLALNTLAFHLTREINLQNKEYLWKTFRGRPGNLIIKWISPFPILERKLERKSNLKGIAAI